MSVFPTVVLAFDPGIAGAYALVDDEGLAMVADLPVLEIATTGGRAKTRSELDVAALANAMREIAPRVDHVFIERVGPRKGQGVTGMFRFGYSAGLIHGIIGVLQLPVTFVTPQVWQRALHVPPSADAARQRAGQLYPSLTKQLHLKSHEHRADALLIASWGMQTLHAGDKAA